MPASPQLHTLLSSFATVQCFGATCSCPPESKGEWSWREDDVNTSQLPKSTEQLIFMSRQSWVRHLGELSAADCSQCAYREPSQLILQSSHTGWRHQAQRGAAQPGPNTHCVRLLAVCRIQASQVRPLAASPAGPRTIRTIGGQNSIQEAACCLPSVQECSTGAQRAVSKGRSGDQHSKMEPWGTLVAGLSHCCVCSCALHGKHCHSRPGHFHVLLMHLCYPVIS